jgi:hypothetical protein
VRRDPSATPADPARPRAGGRSPRASSSARNQVNSGPTRPRKLVHWRRIWRAPAIRYKVDIGQPPESATSGHPSCQKIAPPTTGFRVQPPLADGCSNGPVLQNSRSRPCCPDRHPMQPVRPQFDQPNRCCRP